MIGVAAWVMALALIRDRAALAMSFVLPPILFLAFAAILGGTSGKDLKLKLGVLDEVKAASSQRLVKALAETPAFRFVAIEGTEAAASDMVRLGFVDAAVIIRGDLERRLDQGAPPLLLIESPARPLAGVIAIGQVQKTLNERLPDVVLARILSDVEASGAIDSTDRDVLDHAFAEERAKRSGDGFSFARILERTVVDATDSRNGSILYYAAAVSAIFLLFGAVQGAVSMVDERNNGIAQRIAVGSSLVYDTLGKFLFLVAQGMAQAALVYATAFLVYGITMDWSGFGGWLFAVISAAAAAAGLALMICSLCVSRRQAEVSTTFLVLLCSAVGGSMVPRYLMPPWFQTISWITPNAWIIDALNKASLPRAALQTLVPSGVLIVIAATCTGAALLIDMSRCRGHSSVCL
jgi:ABC-2 type transport system permease protein